MDETPHKVNRNHRNNNSNNHNDYSPERLELLKKLQVKEAFEEQAMITQFRAAQASLEEAHAAWKKEQFQRRKRYMYKNGLEETVENGYNIPFWGWWMNQLQMQQLQHAHQTATDAFIIDGGENSEQ